jgi:hypothetical protein
MMNGRSKCEKNLVTCNLCLSNSREYSIVDIDKIFKGFNQFAFNN